MGNHTILLHEKDAGKFTVWKRETARENKDNLMFMHRGLVGIQHTLLIFGDFGAFGLKFLLRSWQMGLGNLVPVCAGVRWLSSSIQTWRTESGATMKCYVHIRHIYTCLHIQCNKHIVYIFLRTLEKTNDPCLWMLHARFCRIWYVNACIGCLECLECLDRSGRFR